MPSSSIPDSDSVWLPTTPTTRHRRIARSMGFKHSIWLSFLMGSVLFADISAAAIKLAYCSPENTGADFKAVLDIYQSDGKCQETCVADYAYAVVLYQSCWCSNYTPKNQLPLSDCDDPCPGYPTDRCGNRTMTYYNYIELDQHLPSSRTDAPASSTSTSAEETTSNARQTTKPPNTTPAPTPIISITTIQGQQRTITITPSSEPTTSTFAVTSGKSHDFFSDAGRVAGVFVGLAAAVILAVALVFFIRKRKNERRKSVGSSHHPEMGMSGAGSPNLGTGSSSPNGRPRSTSTLGLVGGYSSSDKAPVITTGGFTETDRVTDQRLDPNQIWMRFDNDNGSRVSLRSLQDNQDYSRRVLKLTNPDN
ncbi:Cell wall integrity and stress response component [Drechslerella dactyloides]|uniref:Cell wall integrity and stress response component n=1 Tax=Drechslerella dactyloides TaxID=74499 RepID=A0AAD6NGK1_DREDA|nr:Cell wall integrity and stress response component [Drechslerella dactyloides]